MRTIEGGRQSQKSLEISRSLQKSLDLIPKSSGRRRNLYSEALQVVMGRKQGGISKTRVLQALVA